MLCKMLYLYSRASFRLELRESKFTWTFIASMHLCFMVIESQLSFLFFFAKEFNYTKNDSTMKKNITSVTLHHQHWHMIMV